MIYEFGEERRSRRIARAIVRSRPAAKDWRLRTRPGQCSLRRFGGGWFPAPLDARRGSSVRNMTLPALIPPAYFCWKDFQRGWFWDLFWCLAEAGGRLPYGSDLWKLTGALTRARWDASSAAVLAAFEFDGPDAAGRISLLPALARDHRGAAAKAKGEPFVRQFGRSDFRNFNRRSSERRRFLSL